jgi:hypothetical protein
MLFSNQLSDEIPESLGTLSSLIFIDLSSSKSAQRDDTRIIWGFDISYRASSLL